MKLSNFLAFFPFKSFVLNLIQPFKPHTFPLALFFPHQSLPILILPSTLKASPPFPAALSSSIHAITTNLLSSKISQDISWPVLEPHRSLSTSATLSSTHPHAGHRQPASSSKSFIYHSVTCLMFNFRKCSIPSPKNI